MNAHNDNTARKGLRGWWASPPRSGIRRIIAPWEYRHLRGFAALRIAAASTLAGLGLITLAIGGNDPKAWGWALVWLALAALQASVAYWFLTIARSEPAGT